MSSGAARSAIVRNPHLAPKDATVSAFVLWLQELGLHGEWLQSDLFDEYAAISHLAGRNPTPRKRFKQALTSTGCRCWQADLDIDGRRTRPEMVSIPSGGKEFYL